MAVEAGRVELRVLPDLSKVPSLMRSAIRQIETNNKINLKTAIDTKGIGTAAKEATRKFSAVGVAAGAAVGGLAAAGIARGSAALAQFAVDGVAAFARVEDSTAAASVVFGKATDDVVKFGKNAAKNYGISQGAATDAALTFGTLGKAAGLTGKDLSGFSTKFAGLAGDMASFRGTSPEQAIDAIGAALRGESEPIRAYGVLLDDATLRQEALKLGLIKTIKTGLTPQNKALAAASAITKQTADAQGDFARTSESTANTQKRLAAETENASAQLGQTLAPVMTTVRGIFIQVLPVIGKVAEAVGVFLAAITGKSEVGEFSGALGLLNNIGAEIYHFFSEKLIPTFKSLVAAFKEGGLAGVVTTLASSVSGAMGGILESIGNAAVGIAMKVGGWAVAFVSWIAPLIPGMLAKLGDLLVSIGTWISGVGLPLLVAKVQQWGTAFVAWIGPRIGPMINALGDLLSRAVQWVQNVGLPALVARLSEWGNAFVAWIGPKIPILIGKAQELLARLGGFLRDTALPAIQKQLQQWGSALVEWIGPRVGPMIASLGGLLKSLGSWLIGTALPAIASAVDKWGSALIEWIKPKIPPMLAALGGLLKSLGGWLLTTALPAIVKTLLEWGLALTEWIAPRILPMLGELGKFLAKILGWVLTEGLPKLITAMLDLGTKAVGAIVDALVKYGPDVLRFFADLPSKIITALGNLGDLLLQAGKDLILGMVRGINAVAGQVADAAKNAASGAVNGVKGFLGIKSPSTVFAEIGKFIGEGLVVGLTGTTSDIQGAASKLAAGLNDAFKARIERRSTLIERLIKDNEQIADLARKRADVLVKIAELNDDLDSVKKGKGAAAQRDSIRDRIEAATRSLRDLNVKITRERSAAADVREQIGDLDRLPAVLVKAAALTALKGTLAAQQTVLEGLAAQREKLGDRIKTATSALESAVQLRDGFLQGVAQKHIDLASALGFDKSSLAEGESLTSSRLLSFMTQQLDRIRSFRSQLSQLAKLGLNDTTYRQLADAGAVAGSGVAKALLESAQGAGSAVTAINGLQQAINAESAALGSESASRLYQAGVDAAQGFLQGLQSEDAKLVTQMEHIAESLVTAVKKALGIASPSKVMRALGFNTVRGYELGIGDGDPAGAASAMAAKATAAAHAAWAPESFTSTGGVGAAVQMSGNFYSYDPTELLRAAELKARDAAVVANLQAVV